MKNVLALGCEIRRRREALGWTLHQLSERCGVTPNFIGTIENGKRDPSLSTIHRIAVGLGVPLSELLGVRSQLSPPTIEIAKLFEQTVGEIQTALLLLLRNAVKQGRR